MLVAVLFVAGAYVVNIGVSEYMRAFRHEQRMHRLDRHGCRTFTDSLAHSMWKWGV